MIIGYLKDGIEISFQTRGVDDETADFLWNQLSPSRIKQFTEETGHNLVVYDKSGKEVCVNIESKKSKKSNNISYTVHCGQS